jgi:hypothetical protein
MGYKVSLLRPVYFSPLSCQLAQLSFAAPDDVLFWYQSIKEKYTHGGGGGGVNITHSYGPYVVWLCSRSEYSVNPVCQCPQENLKMCP